MSAVIGLTRVLLRAHYLSDVIGGFGLGLGVYGLAAVVLLLSAGRTRAGRREPPPPDAPSTVERADG